MANNRFKVDNGLSVTGNAEFYQRIDAFANAHFNNDLFVVSGNLVVNGTLIFANVVVGNGGIRSVADQQDLGNTTNRFNLFGYRVQVDDTIVPGANGVAAGNTTRRFEVFANNLNATTITVGATSINSTYFDGTAKSANTVNGLYANGFIVRTGNTTAEARSVNVSSNGITITNGDGIAGNPTLALILGSGHFANTTGLFVNLSSVGVGTLPILRGGTGGPDRATGLNNLLPAQNAAVTSYVLKTDGTNASWVLSTGPTGFTGSVGATGFTGSIGATGFTGSAGTNGFWGSAGGIGFTGSVGFTGSAGGTGFSGSGGLGFTGSVGFTGSLGTNGFWGSAGAVGFTGSAGSYNQSLNTSNSPTFAGLTINGAITATGDITAFFSDDRLKTKLGNIDSALDKLLTLSGFIFEPNELAQSLGYEKKREVGVSAQEVKIVLPEAITPAAIDSKYLAVKYERLIPLIIEAIKELKIEIDNMKDSG
jgi:hypothetical protein